MAEYCKNANKPMHSFIYREFAASTTMGHYIKKFWLLDNSPNAQPLANKSILPNGCFNIAFIEGEGIEVSTRRGHTTLTGGIYLCCQFTLGLDIRIKPFTRIFLVQMYPWCLGMFSQYPLSDSADLIIPLDEINRRMYRSIHGLESYSEQAIMDFFEGKFKEYFEATDDAKLIQTACSLVHEKRGILTVGDLANSVRYSTRLLEKKFVHQVGLSPKEFSLIVRIRSSVDELSNLQVLMRAYPMSQLALDAGFYDQAHFIKAFHKVVRTTPGRFNREAFLLSLQQARLSGMDSFVKAI